ncbi:MAG: T9SS type A sorting domain-containing protein [Candidatus Marinimicrobia bacterium]|nr:T9SS type A sorting domain-containing protein [Candidatus Neomarinimicrobiota bacterium]
MLPAELAGYQSPEQIMRLKLHGPLDAALIPTLLGEMTLEALASGDMDLLFGEGTGALFDEAPHLFLNPGSPFRLAKTAAARTEVYFNQTWDGSAFRTTRSNGYTWDAAENLTHLIFENFDGTFFSWTNNIQAFYTYDANGNLTYYQFESWNINTGAWAKYFSVTQTYDANNNRTFYQSESWNTDTGEQTGGFRWTSSYDANGNHTQDLNERWDTTTLTWVTDSRDTWTYTNNQLTTYLHETWDAAISDYVNSLLFTAYTYDTSGNLLSFLWQTWDSDLPAWIDRYRFTLTYDGSNLASSSREVWDDVAGIWNLASLTTYNYDDNGNLTLFQNEGYFDFFNNTYSTTAISGFQFIYTYDTQDRRLTRLFSTWDVASASWAPLSRFTNTWSDSYTLAHSLVERWDGVNSVWENSSRFAFVNDDPLAVVPAPEVASIMDIPADQGGQVRLRFQASWLDTLSLAVRDSNNIELLISSYSIWRKLGNETWDALGSFDATGDTVYYFVASTLADSSKAGTPWFTYRVTAHSYDDISPSGGPIFYSSEPDSGYSVDNLAPDSVGSVSASISAGLITFTWAPVYAPDLMGYHIFESIAGSFDPGASLAYTISTEASIAMPTDGLDHAYVVVAEDIHNNLGLASAAVALSSLGIVAGAGLPERYALHPNYPNPFNPSTTLRFDMPEAGDLYLTIYDLAGREVSRPAEGYHKAGYHTITWNGRDINGATLPSGVYVARMVSPGFSKSIKMVLLK